MSVVGCSLVGLAVGTGINAARSKPSVDAPAAVLPTLENGARVRGW